MQQPCKIVWIFFLLWVAAAVDAAPTYWTITPQPQDEIPLVDVARLGGRTLPGDDGVHFRLPDLKPNQPVEVFLSSELGPPLELIAFKTRPEEPLLQVSTGDKGSAELRFRAAGTVYFRVSGPEGASYQMIVLRARPIDMTGAGSFIPMSEVTPPEAASAPKTAAGETERAAAAPAGSGGMTLVLVLLGLILVALVVIAFALLRGRRGAAAILLAALALPLVGHSPDARAFDRATFTRSRVLRGDKPIPEYVKPSLIARDNLSPKGDGFVLGAKKRWDSVSSGHGQAAKITNAALAAGGFVERLFGYMDPNDAAVQPNYHPRGIPPLPASILDDPTAPGLRRIEYEKIADRIEKARRHLEGNYVVLKQTELEAGLITEMAEAAAGLSPFAQLAWTRMKANPKTSFNVSARKFYAKYDAGQQSGLDYLNEALKDMGEFEAKYYGQRNWYLYFGLPFHQFMTARYLRPEK